MPGRPPREWFARCTTDVADKGSAVDPAAVCGAVWARKDEHDKRAIARTEETMSAKRKKKRPNHRGGAAVHKKHKGRSATKPTKRAAHRKTARAPARHAGARTKHETRCGHCGHAAAHARGHGCLHFDGRKFCSCKHRS
jgi:hypothetical protein